MSSKNGFWNASRRGLTAVGVIAAVMVVAILVVIASLSGGGPQKATASGGHAETPEAPVEDAPKAMTDAGRDATMKRVRNALASGSLGEAQSVLAEAVEEFPDDQQLHLAMADLLMEREDVAGALAAQLEAINIGPASAPMHFTAGVLAERAERNDLALEQYFAAHQKDQGNAEYLIYLANAEMEAGELPQAEVHLAAARRLDPSRAQVYAMLAQIQLKNNKPSVAAGLAGQARQRDPGNVGYRLIEATALRRDGKPEEALTTLTGVPDEYKYSFAVLQGRAESYGLLGRPDEAAMMFVEASEMNPSDVDLAREAAIWIDRLGDSAGAVMFAERAASLGDPVAAKMLERLTSEPEG